MRHRVAIVLLFCAVAVFVSATAIQAAPKASAFTVTVLDAQTGAKAYGALVVAWYAKEVAPGVWVKVDNGQLAAFASSGKSGKADLWGLAPNTHYFLEVGRSTAFPIYSGVILTNKSGGGSVTVHI